VRRIASLVLRISISLATIFFGASSALQLPATHLIQVSQPVVVDDSTVVIAPVLYEDFVGADDPVLRHVSFTIAPNHIPGYIHPPNRNAAAILGIALGLPRTRICRTEFPLGDTLAVDIDVSAAFDSTSGRQVHPYWASLGNSAVVQTAQCVLINARRNWPTVQYVRIAIRGSETYRELEGLYPLERVEVPYTPWRMLARTLKY